MTARTGSSPLVSVVVPTYDRSGLLRTAVESVFGQTYEAIELIIVDDGSEIPAWQAVADVSIPPHIDVKHIRHDENRGANAARNTGIKAAAGTFIAFLDDDDYWHPQKVERQVAVLGDATDEVGVVFTGQRYVNGAGEVTNVTRPPPEGEFTDVLVNGGHFGSFSNVMAREEVFERTGYLDERLPCWQDRDWYFQVATDYDFTSIPELLTVRRFTSSPQISDQFEPQREIAYPLLLEKHRETAATLGPEGERAFLAIMARGVAVAALKDQSYRDAVRFFLRSLSHQPTNLRLYAYLLVAAGGEFTHRAAQFGKRLINRYLLDTDDVDGFEPTIGANDR